jgi:hypothetical protein
MADTDTYISERMIERKANISPPDDVPFSLLACAVIYSAARDWHSTGNKERDMVANADLVRFFNGVDYRFWTRFTNLRLEGSQMLAMLVENGGISSPVHLIRADEIGGVE